MLRLRDPVGDYLVVSGPTLDVEAVPVRRAASITNSIGGILVLETFQHLTLNHERVSPGYSDKSVCRKPEKMALGSLCIGTLLLKYRGRDG